MASSPGACGLVALNNIVVPNQANEKDHHQDQIQLQQEDHSNNFDYSQRAQWLRAAVLGANDGLVSISSLIMGVGAVRKDVRAMLLAGIVGTVAGACSMAIGEFVSVYTQYEVEVGQMMREEKMNQNNNTGYGDLNEKDLEMQIDEKKKSLPNPLQAASASAFSFFIGALVPLLAAAFIADYKVRLAVVVAAASLALVVFGGVGALLGKTPVVRTSIRVLIGGWVALAITFGLTKLLDSIGLEFD